MNDGNLIIPAPLLATVPVHGTDKRFPVRRVYCVGRNYAEHIREMGGDERDPPFFFQKPSDAIETNGATIPYPTITQDFQHEVELVLAIGREGEHIAASDAASHVFGIAVGIDLTRRDVQITARKTGRPWEIGKSFDRSAPCGALVQLTGPLPARGWIELQVNGSTRQKGNLAQMIWSASEIVSELSAQYKLFPGDLIFTGTPAGVGPLQPGDQVRAQVEGLPALHISIATSTR
ncbi:MAG TPA: fumarylacetoacetate hydrolase family protein [Ramlibacter sp.]|nr:fumarylacetoacetate hydrolase family protein [Ramlibacter sp.]